MIQSSLYTILNYISRLEDWLNGKMCEEEGKK